jgi:hypothetical protein
MNCLCALLNAAGEELEENNENLYEYFSTIEDIWESRNGGMVIKFRRQKWIRGKYQYSMNDYTQKELKDIHFLRSYV